MTRETISDFIPWDDYYDTRDTGEDKKEKTKSLTSPNKKEVHKVYIDTKGIWLPIEEYNQMEELESRRMLNAIAKQKKRK